MNISVLTDRQAIAVGVLALLAGAYVYRYRQTKFNIASNQNLAYSAVNGIGDILDDNAENGSFSLGAWIYEITHPNEDLGLGPY